MTTIHATDILHATLTQYGKTLTNVCLCGLTSLADVVRHLRQTVPGISGISRLDIRNATQGWSTRTGIYLR